MEKPGIVTTARGQSSARGSRPASEPWWLVGVVGLAFFVTGWVDFLLAWLPPQFGNGEWTFGTVTQAFNGLPVLLMGTVFLFAAARRCDVGWWERLAGIGAAVLAIWIVGGAGLWLVQVPLALATVPEGIALGLQKAVIKTAVQAIVYGSLLVLVVLRWRRSR